ncbi:hypothetical protein LSAT2_004912 [Lamellibrachia satsuma]|nr:hypothetical protein LSAT2_004912 [Lamellibrachia satsuma]
MLVSSVQPTEAKNAYESCIYDVCVSRNQKKAACDSLQAFAAACEHNGVVSNWRIRTGCRCPGDLKWSRCGRKCNATRTCSNRNVKCGFRCIRKCECSRRTPYQQGDSCLSFPQCRAAGLL